MLPFLRVDPNRHWPVVGERHLHVGAEAARRGFNPLPGHSGDELLIHSLGLNRGRGVNKTRATALPAIAVKCELAHHEYRSTRFDQRTIHLSFVVFKYPHVDNLVCEPVEFLFRIRRGDAEQDQQTGGDLAGCFSVDYHLGPAYSLNTRSHGVEDIGLSEFQQLRGAWL